MLISIAIPCYKSEKTIKNVVDEIRNVFRAQTKHDYQIVLVNDYPFDSTFSVIEKLCNSDSKIIGVNLSRNFGQACAKMAALPYAQGDAVVFMDDDGQHPADGIIALAEKISEGFDVVYANFRHKKHSLFKRITSDINAKISEFNGTRAKGISVSSFYAISRFTADAFTEYNSPFPSMGGFQNTLVGKTANIDMPHRERMDGKSNYTFKKLLKVWFTSFTNFSIVPLRVIAFLGTFIAFLGFLFGLTIIITKLMNPALAAGYASTMAVMLFLGGLILLALGFIGEYIGRIYMTVSNLQQYRVRTVVNSDIKK